MLQSWNQLIENFRHIGDRVADITWNGDIPLSRQETYRQLMAAMAQGYLNMVYANPDLPDWTPTLNNVLNMAAPNPDFIYLYAAIRPGGTYRISGYRGSSLFAYINQGRDFYANTKTPGPALDGINLDDMQIGADGYFEILVSPERPADVNGNWWRLHPDTNYFAVRTAAYDWLRETDPRLAIDKLDTPIAPRRLSAQEINERLIKLASWIENATTIWFNHMNEMRSKDIVNRLEVYDYGSVGGFVGQVYLEGLYQLAEDEALILETEIPEKSFYWSFLVTDDQFTTVDYMNRQSSLNPAQIHVDSDGKFRAVISAGDPGVQNWLDTGGYTSGIIQGRWNQCSSNPQPTLTKVKLDEVRGHLPDNTPVLDRQARDVQLRRRRVGAQLRRRW